jgi:maltooligosyltrehalose trehalohydrolase
MPSEPLELGATRLAGDLHSATAGSVQFVVWAPLAAQVDVHLLSPAERLVPMESLSGGYFAARVADLPSGTTYFYRLTRPDGATVERPDPVSRSQPQGVHGPSAVVECDFAWSDAAWRGRALGEYVVYELHVGTFTPAGTFDAIVERLDALAELGVTAIEIMPVAQFPGERNWGYDGVYPFAGQHSYGGAPGLKRLVDACHRRSLAVVLDVVYNHLGPEGNYLSEFGPYFTDRYRTPWGEAINFDGPESDEVRRYFIANALQWVDEFHIDALRLDAVHAIFDNSAQPFLRELADAVHGRARQLDRRIFLIAETNRNNPVSVMPASKGGFGLDAQWVDDFGRATHALLTGERHGFYSDFGAVHDVAKAMREGYILTGQYSRYRRRRHGMPAGQVPADRFLVFAQNHDEVGNRPGGERLGWLVDFEQLKLAAATTLLSPYVPLIFMGEEYDETAPFYYFVSHSDSGLIENVRAGRRRDMPAASALSAADPQGLETFLASRLNFDLRRKGEHAVLWRYYQRLLFLRRWCPAIRQTDSAASLVESSQDAPVIVAHRRNADHEICLLLNFGPEPAEITAGAWLERGPWIKALDSAAPEWNGPGETWPARLSVDDARPLGESKVQPYSCVLLRSNTSERE